MPAHLTVSRRPGPERLLGSVVLIIIVLAVLYAGWIGISNFSRIHV